MQAAGAATSKAQRAERLEAGGKVQSVDSGQGQWCGRDWALSGASLRQMFRFVLWSGTKENEKKGNSAQRQEDQCEVVDISP